MKKIKIGECDKNLQYSFRESCFAIYVKNNKMLVTKKEDGYTMLGAALKPNEKKDACIKREFLEQSGLSVKKAKQIVTIDCFFVAGKTFPLHCVAHIFVVDVDKNAKKEQVEFGNNTTFMELGVVDEVLVMPYLRKAYEFYMQSKYNKNK